MHLTRLIIQSSGIVEPKELKQKGLVETFIVRKKSKSFEIDIASSNLPELFLELPRFAEVISIAIVDSTKERNRNRNLPGLDLLAIFLDGLSLMTSERYWEAHGKLESVWKPSSGELKQTLWSIIQLCASMVKFQMGQEKVSSAMYRRTTKYMSQLSLLDGIMPGFPPEFVYPAAFPFPWKLIRFISKQI